MYLLAYEIGKGKTKYPFNPCYLYSNNSCEFVQFALKKESLSLSNRIERIVSLPVIIRSVADI